MDPPAPWKNGNKLAVIGTASAVLSGTAVVYQRQYSKAIPNTHHDEVALDSGYLPLPLLAVAQAGDLPLLMLLREAARDPPAC